MVFDKIVTVKIREEDCKSRNVVVIKVVVKKFQKGKTIRIF